MFFRRFKPAFSDGVVDLVPTLYGAVDDGMGFGQVEDYIIVPHGTRQEAGRISVRFGESRCVYYFGHIGYHVDPPWQGQHFAARACALVAPMLAAAGKNSVVITNDPDNWPSRRTCERLGCTLERVVHVPQDIRDRWEISAVKCRYIWRVNSTLALPEIHL